MMPSCATGCRRPCRPRRRRSLLSYLRSGKPSAPIVDLNQAWRFLSPKKYLKKTKKFSFLFSSLKKEKKDGKRKGARPQKLTSHTKIKPLNSEGDDNRQRRERDRERERAAMAVVITEKGGEEERN